MRPLKYHLIYFFCTELISKEEEYGKRVLFPGNKWEDVLRKIVSLVGSQGHAFDKGSVGGIGYLRRMGYAAPTPLSNVFSEAGEDVLDLLGKMIAFDCEKRPTALQLLQHRYFRSIHNQKEVEKVLSCVKKFDFRVVAMTGMHSLPLILTFSDKFMIHKDFFDMIMKWNKAKNGISKVILNKKIVKIETRDKEEELSPDLARLVVEVAGGSTPKKKSKESTPGYSTTMNDVLLSVWESVEEEEERENISRAEK